jgi:hypothetical protein
MTDFLLSLTRSTWPQHGLFTQQSSSTTHVDASVSSGNCTANSFKNDWCLRIIATVKNEQVFKTFTQIRTVTTSCHKDNLSDSWLPHSLSTSSFFDFNALNKHCISKQTSDSNDSYAPVVEKFSLAHEWAQYFPETSRMEETRADGSSGSDQICYVFTVLARGISIKFHF